MPETFIVIGEYDPLREEVLADANKLKAANVLVIEKCYPKMIHGFFQFGGVFGEGKAAIEEVARFLRSIFNA